MDHGDLVSFRYSAVHKRGTKAHDSNPTVFVLHPNYEGMVHGLNWGLMSPSQQNMIRMILDRNFEAQHKQAFVRTDPELVRLYDRTMRDATTRSVSSAYLFYTHVIKPLISKGQLSTAQGVAWEPYRKYRLDRISGVRIEEPAAMMTGKHKAAGTSQWGGDPLAQGGSSEWNPQQENRRVWDRFVESVRGTRGHVLPYRGLNFRRND